MPKITKRFVDNAPPGRHYDENLPGFGLYVGAKGKRSYFFEYRPGSGRGVNKRRMSIGKHGNPWTPDMARGEAKRLQGLIAEGRDPLEERKGISVSRLADLAEQWLQEVAAKRKPRTAHDYRRLIEKHINPKLGKLDIVNIERPIIARLHHAMRATPAEANYVLRVLSSFFTWSEQRGYRPDNTNPCRHVTKYRENKRERYLSPKELRRLSRALAAAEKSKILTQWMVGAIRLLVFTGARLGEVLGLRWQEVDLEAGVLRLPDSKTGAKVIHLNAPARAVLANLPRLTDNPHVICGKKPGAALVNLEKPWRRVRKAALLNDVRLHDLRHSHASVAVAGGLSLPLVGALLGHSQPGTTARYAHLADDPIRAASELVGQRLADAMSGTAPNNVHSMSEK